MNEITRRRLLVNTITGGSALALGGCISPGSKAGPRRPNLVFVFPDQMRGSAMGFRGMEPVITPNLDRFAQQSLVLTDAVSNYPICSPFRASMFSGRYPLGTGVVNNCMSRSAPHDCELKADEQCWSDVLAEQGYALGYIGKWHLDSPKRPYVDTYNNRGKLAWNEWTSPDRRHGFDFWHAYGTFDRHNHPEYWTTDAPRNRRTVSPKWGPEYEADLALEFIRDRKGKMRDPNRPFALVVSMNPPHMPYQMVPQRYLDHYQGKKPKDLINKKSIDLEHNNRFTRLAKKHTINYFAQITGVDDQFGRILAGLEEEGLAENTIVVFCSDHGNCLGCHNQISKNNPYEESIIIPFLIRWPGHIKPRQDDLLLSTPDIHPTLLGLLGLGEHIPATVEGTNFSALFRTGKGQRPTSALYMKMPIGNPTHGLRGVRTHRYTMVMNSKDRKQKKPMLGEEIILFDNQKDPHQLVNIAPNNPELVTRLHRDELLPWLHYTNDLWQPKKQLNTSPRK